MTIVSVMVIINVASCSSAIAADSVTLATNRATASSTVRIGLVSSTEAVNMAVADSVVLVSTESETVVVYAVVAVLASVSAAVSVISLTNVAATV